MIGSGFRKNIMGNEVVLWQNFRTSWAKWRPNFHNSSRGRNGKNFHSAWANSFGRMGQARTEVTVVLQYDLCKIFLLIVSFLPQFSSSCTCVPES
ncbi:hypothetical protein BaRGS_00028890 [Batillaria attramentaria]|uniref:Uncharacterized protein n=1 Tax=Batillaria attramentaria TaxID=370345 RepID=A0ABD0JXM9_9CAEN